LLYAYRFSVYQTAAIQAILAPPNKGSAHETGSS
jgi:hypothetical protein